jgi:hypothetical protein
MEYFLILLTDPKFISPVVTAIFGGSLRSLQVNYAQSFILFIIRLIFMLLSGVLVFLFFSEVKEDLIYNILASGAIGYFSVDLANTIYKWRIG